MHATLPKRPKRSTDVVVAPRCVTPETLLVDLGELIAHIRYGRDHGVIQPLAANKALGCVGNAHQILSSAFGHPDQWRETSPLVIGETPSHPIAALAPYRHWPSDREPCPKCGGRKRRHVTWVRANKDGPERLRQECMCGYAIHTHICDGNYGDADDAAHDR